MGTKFRLKFPNEEAELCTRLALRSRAEFTARRRKREECLPDSLDTEDVYNFLKEDQRIYPLHEDIPLVRTEGGGKFSDPLAMIRVIGPLKYCKKDGKIYTRGSYEIVESLVQSFRDFNGL